jgi:hypothetical protein
MVVVLIGPFPPTVAEIPEIGRVESAGRWTLMGGCWLAGAGARGAIPVTGARAGAYWPWFPGYRCVRSETADGNRGSLMRG